MALLNQSCLEKSNQSTVLANLNQRRRREERILLLTTTWENWRSLSSARTFKALGKSQVAIHTLQPQRGASQPHLFPVTADFHYTVSACPSQLEADVLTSGAKLLDSSSLWTLHTKCKHFLSFGQTLAQETFFPMLTAGSLNKSSVSRRVGERKS